MSRCIAQAVSTGVRCRLITKSGAKTCRIHSHPSTYQKVDPTTTTTNKRCDSFVAKTNIQCRNSVQLGSSKCFSHRKKNQPIAGGVSNTTDGLVNGIGVNVDGKRGAQAIVFTLDDQPRILGFGGNGIVLEPGLKCSEHIALEIRKQLVSKIGPLKAITLEHKKSELAKKAIRQNSENIGNFILDVSQPIEGKERITLLKHLLDSLVGVDLASQFLSTKVKNLKTSAKIDETIDRIMPHAEHHQRLQLGTILFLLGNSQLASAHSTKAISNMRQLLSSKTTMMITQSESKTGVMSSDNTQIESKTGVMSSDNLPPWYYMFSDVVQSIQRLHNAGIYHLNIKPDNLLLFRITDELKFQLSDFGASATTDEEITAAIIWGQNYGLCPPSTIIEASNGRKSWNPELQKEAGRRNNLSVRQLAGGIMDWYTFLGCVGLWVTSTTSNMKRKELADIQDWLNKARSECEQFTMTEDMAKYLLENLPTYQTSPSS